MEAPLHQSPVAVPSLGSGVIMAPASSWSAPPPQQQHQQQDAIGATVRHQQQQQQAAAVSAAIMAHQNQKPPLPPVAVTMAMARGREQCPRCASRDTKFCYYNNYNTAQPRHFCRACRRYWTLGGSLRNVPVGGSTRKRPRPARPNRAMAVSAATMRSTTSSCVGAASPALAPAQQTGGGGLLSSLLLLGSKVPLLEGRLGGSDLVSLGGQQPAFAGDFLAQLGLIGAGGPLLWPPATATTVLEADSAETMTTWKSRGAVPPASALWQELAAAMPAAASPAPQLLL